MASKTKDRLPIARLIAFVLLLLIETWAILTAPQSPISRFAVYCAGALLIALLIFTIIAALSRRSKRPRAGIIREDQTYF
jgi:hypothetical protein